MDEPIPFKRPIRWTAPRADEAETLIREWAKDTARVLITTHALDRIDERMEGPVIDTPTVYRILQRGRVSGHPVRNERGHWQATMMSRMPGGRDICAVTVIVRDDRRLIVRTVMWKDFEA